MQCAHEICTCTVPTAGEYCSPSCRTGIEQGDQCFCGHPDCAANQVP
jgi:hypothetical protein